MIRITLNIRGLELFLATSRFTPQIVNFALFESYLYRAMNQHEIKAVRLARVAASNGAAIKLEPDANGMFAAFPPNPIDQQVARELYEQGFRDLPEDHERIIIGAKIAAFLIRTGRFQ